MILEKLLKITNVLLMPNISEFIQMMDTESVQFHSLTSLLHENYIMQYATTMQHSKQKIEL